MPFHRPLERLAPLGLAVILAPGRASRVGEPPPNNQARSADFAFFGGPGWKWTSKKKKEIQMIRIGLQTARNIKTRSIHLFLVSASLLPRPRPIAVLTALSSLTVAADPSSLDTLSLPTRGRPRILNSTQPRAALATPSPPLTWPASRRSSPCRLAPTRPSFSHTTPGHIVTCAPSANKLSSERL